MIMNLVNIFCFLYFDVKLVNIFYLNKDPKEESDKIFFNLLQFMLVLK
jgi:hypothetical protein